MHPSQLLLPVAAALIALVLALTLIAIRPASAAHLAVDGGVVQVFRFAIEDLPGKPEGDGSAGTVENDRGAGLDGGGSDRPPAAADGEAGDSSASHPVATDAVDDDRGEAPDGGSGQRSPAPAEGSSETPATDEASESQPDPDPKTGVLPLVGIGEN